MSDSIAELEDHILHSSLLVHLKKVYYLRKCIDRVSQLFKLYIKKEDCITTLCMFEFNACEITTAPVWTF